METSHAVLIAVDEEEQRVIVGRTLLQKKLYFACVLLGQDLGFRPHYYGPYSRQVADATDSLVTNRFLEEQVEVFPEGNVFGERRRHSYKITQEGAALLQSVNQQTDARPWHETLQKINSHPVAADFNLLSIAAKAATIRARVREASPKDISRHANAYGWKLPPDKLELAEEFLAHLGLGLD